MVNGRIGEDDGVGKCTYVGSRGSGLIDYVIADTELFKYFSNFCVEDPNILSDHCAVKFMLTFCVSCNSHSTKIDAYLKIPCLHYFHSYSCLNMLEFSKNHTIPQFPNIGWYFKTNLNKIKVFFKKNMF